MGMSTMIARHQMEKETVADSKLVKFETTVNTIKEYLNPRKPYGGIFGGMLNAKLTDFSIEENKIFSPQMYTKYIHNLYVKVLDDALLQVGGIWRNDISYITENDVVKIYKTNEDKYRFKSYIFVFWMLFTTAIDDEIYNNELSGIIDLAYCLDFNEVMIRDWCRAIEYVLAGNHLSEDCDLECESEEGKRFFLHK